MEWFNKFLEKFKNQSKKKLIENAIIVIIVGIIIIIAGGTIFGSNGQKDVKSKPPDGTSVEVANKTTEAEERSDLEVKLASILSKIDGAGKVDVMITYVSGREIVPAYDIRSNENSTQERDNGGGTRNITQSDKEQKIAYEEEQGGIRKPIIVKDLQPVVKGVVVVADGAREPVVRESISRAVQVLMDIPIHKIEVLERKK